MALNSKKVIRIFQWNARGVVNKRPWVITRRAYPLLDILMFQETWLTPPMLYTLPGFTVYRLDRPNQNGGGLLTAVRSTIPSMRGGEEQGDGWASLDVTIFLPEGSLLLRNVYWNPRAAQEGTPPDPFVNLPTRAFVGGDFNAAHPTWGSTTATRGGRRLASLFLSSPCSLLNTGEATRIAYNSSSCLDLSFCSSSFLLGSTWRVWDDPGNSDHLPVETSLPLECSSIRRPCRVMDWSRYRRISDDMVSSLLTCGHPLPSYEDFIQALKTAGRAATRTISAPDTPWYQRWWNTACRRALVAKHRALRLARRTLRREDWIAYKASTATLRKVIQSAKRSFWDSLCSQAANSGRLFPLIRSLRRRASQVAPTSSAIIDTQGGPTADPGVIASLFASQFGKPPIEESIVGVSPSSPPSSDLLTLPVSWPEFCSGLSALRSNALGPEGISRPMLSNLSDRCRRVLWRIFNVLWSSLSVPATWRTATVLPLPKPKRDKRLLSSYRPIALTSPVSKVMENIVKRRLEKFLEAYCPLSPRQVGFRKGHSTHDVLLELHHDTIVALERHHFHVCCSLDLEGAYDNVWIPGLLFKLRSRGVPSKLVSWLDRFLSRRWFRVRWGESFSPLHRSRRGLPQGCILSPLLFALYMDDLYQEVSPPTSIMAYADDIVLFTSGPNLVSVLSNIQRAIRAVERWALRWWMKISPAKSSLLLVTRRGTPPLPQLGVQEGTIPWVRTQRVLGVRRDSRGSLIPYINDLEEAFTRDLGILRSLAHPKGGASVRDMLMLTRTILRGRLEYAAPLLACEPFSQRSRLRHLYNVALRFALGLPRNTPIPVLYRLAGEPDIAARQELLLFRLYVRYLESASSLPLESMCRDSEALHFYHWRSRRVHFALRAHDLAEQASLPTQNILRAPGNIPLLPEDKVTFSYAGLDFQDTSLPPTITQAFFREALETWSRNSYVYGTDASRTAEGVGGGIFCRELDINVSLRFNSLCSVFSAEAMTIWMALDLYVSRDRPAVLLTDSQAVVRALASPTYPRNTILVNILRLLHWVASATGHVSVVWVPGHRGLVPNEEADRLAKQGAMDSTNAELPIVTGPDILSAFASFLRRNEDRTWALFLEDSRIMYRSVGRGIHFGTQIGRRGEVLLLRLSLNRAPLQEFLFRIGRSSSPLCSTCGERESSTHYMLSCRRYSRLRSTFLAGHFPQDPTEEDLAAVFLRTTSSTDTSTCFDVWEFVRRTGRFSGM